MIAPIDLKRMSQYKHGSEALIFAIWKKFGGQAAIKHTYFPKVGRQCFSNWQDRGRVPLKLVNIVANGLKIPKWGLNYEELSMLYPKEIPLWKDVVKSYNLGKAAEDVILFLTPPKKYG